MAEDALDVALLVAAAIERVGGEYFVGGSLAATHHASPDSDMRGILPDQASHADVLDWLATCDADVLIVGHTHRAIALRSIDSHLRSLLTPNGHRCAALQENWSGR